MPTAEVETGSSDGYWGSTPIPDPTRLTTDAVTAVSDQLRREAAAARELMQAQMDGMTHETGMVSGRVDDLRHESSRAREELQSTFDRGMESVRGEIRALRELTEAWVEGNDRATALFRAEQDRQMNLQRKLVDSAIEIIRTRINGMDEATKLLAVNLDKVPYVILQETGNLRSYILSQIQNVSDVNVEKFHAIDGTFASNALALTAALAAQKEAAAEQNKSNTLAITKSEQATKETIAANAAQTTAGLVSQAANIADLKERLVRIESGGLAVAASRTEGRADATFTQTEHLASAAAARASISIAVASLSVLVAVVLGILLAVKR